MSPSTSPAGMPAPPTLVVVTDRAIAAAAGHTVVDAVRAALDGGAPAILLRDKQRPTTDRRELGEAIAPLVRAAGARLWVTADVALARDLGADGVHLPGDLERPPDWAGPVSRSVHGSAELERARREGAAHAYVAPVAPTTSKPGYGPALGVSGVRRLVDEAAGLPLLALGGVGPDDLAVWRAAGAAGVAVMGGVMGAADPAEAVRRLLDAWRTAERGPGAVTSHPATATSHATPDRAPDPAPGAPTNATDRTTEPR